MGTSGTVEISCVRSIPKGVPLEFDVQLESPQFDPDQPPTVEISIRNVSESPLRYQTGLFEVFGSSQSEEANPGLLLLPTGWEVRTEHPLRPQKDYAVFDAVLYTTSIDAGRKVRTRRTIWDHPRNEGDVFQPGAYTFVTEYTNADDETTFE